MFAVGIGMLVTLLLLGLAFAADLAGFESLATALLWQNSLLQSLVPMGNIGSAEHPVYEGSPLNLIVFVASFPDGMAIYGLAAFLLMSRLARRGQ
jgi:hypothetical protein